MTAALLRRSRMFAEHAGVHVRILTIAPDLDVPPARAALVARGELGPTPRHRASGAEQRVAALHQLLDAGRVVGVVGAQPAHRLPDGRGGSLDPRDLVLDP